jgi:hypothetical protein
LNPFRTKPFLNQKRRLTSRDDSGSCAMPTK